MDTANKLFQRFPHVLAERPAIPGLAVVTGLVFAAASGVTFNLTPSVWPLVALLLTIVVVINSGGQDLRREIQLRRHLRRMATAHAILADRGEMIADRGEAEAAENAGSLRRLEGLVDEFGRKLDDLLREVHAETVAAGQKQRRA
jgi:hypothetical protein